MRIKTFTDKLFHCKVRLFSGYDKGEVEKYVDKDSKGKYFLKAEEEERVGFSFYYMNPDGEGIHGIAIKFPGMHAPNLGIVAHEVGHVVFRMMEFAGIPISKENDETFLYLQSYWMEEILPILINWQKGNKKK